MTDHFSTYLKKLCETPLDQHTEHTGRSALQGLLDEFAAQSGQAKTSVQHEPKRVTDKGAPDFKVTRAGMILGYVETKKIGENLDLVLKSDQIEKYRKLSNNILLTDYLHFIWLRKDEVKREILCHATDIESRQFRLAADRSAAVAALLEGFFSTAPEGIGRAKPLALALAERSRLLCDYLDEELKRQKQQDSEGRLYGLFSVFRAQIFHDLTVADFADAFAQMLAYGLFLARLNADSSTVTLSNAREYVPASFELIRELVDFLSELNKNEYRDVRWVVEEVLSIVNGLDLAAIREDLSFQRRKAIDPGIRAADEEEHRLFERDPFIYLYEDYLGAYDKETRKARGVYYTPPPIVNFIVRAVDDILKASFGIHDGLADHRRVTVLDFACGTGTFLLEIFERIFDNIGGPDSGRAEPIVREHLLKNVFGFEYLIAPYTIAHLKLSQYLKDRGHPLKATERLNVFLTNTLEPIEPQKNLLLPAITAEVEAAQSVKDKPILVIVGNPPYSGHSKNKGKWITDAIDGYKLTIETDANGHEVEKPLGERNSKWLNDDYVKFMRFAQLKMDAVQEGVVGIITNHSWLDNPTFRGMRQSLMRSFQQIYVLDLHGSTKKSEQTPDGSKDENVFDIKQGVAVSLFVKHSKIERGVWKGDLWGRRIDKYRVAATSVFAAMNLTPIDPRPPKYQFSTQNAKLEAEYEQGVSIRDTLQTGSVGIVTGDDKIFINFTTSELRESVVNRFGTCSDDLIQPIMYRPFDSRIIYYDTKLLERARAKVMRRMLDAQSIGLSLPRQVKTGNHWHHCAVAETMSESTYVSNRTSEIAYCYPLYLNGTENFTTIFRTFLNGRYEHHYTPEEILGYIYAVLYAPTYRSRYAEFLRMDFPRIPFSERADDFEVLSVLGWALVQAHLLRELPRRNLGGYHGKGDHRVEKPRYAPTEQAIWINKSQYFAPVPSAVWEFHIGSYQILDKYLKSRKGRKLSLNEITHIGVVADSLAFTIDQMAKIDRAYRAAFPDQL